MKKLWTKSGLCLAILLFPILLMGQGRQVESSNQQWFQYYNKIRLSEKWSWLSDAGYRWGDMFSENKVYFLRTGAGLHFAPKAIAIIGINVNGALDDEVIQRYEFRPYQEVALSRNFGKLKLGHRFRSEQRFFVRADQSGQSFVQRFRYRASLKVPLLRLSAKNPEARLFLGLADEVFLNLVNEHESRVLDKNRLMVSSIFQLGENCSLTLTYNRQFSPTEQNGTYSLKNVVLFGINHQIDLRGEGPNLPELTQN